MYEKSTKCMENEVWLELIEGQDLICINGLVRIFRELTKHQRLKCKTRICHFISCLVTTVFCSILELALK